MHVINHGECFITDKQCIHNLKGMSDLFALKIRNVDLYSDLNFKTVYGPETPARPLFGKHDT